MENSRLKYTRFTGNRFCKLVSVLKAGFRSPTMFGCAIRRMLKEVYRHEISHTGLIASVPLYRIVPADTRVSLVNFGIRDGNVSVYELLCIGTIVAHCCPQVILEIGTFDGNSTLQMALNAPSDANIYTLDLPSHRQISCSKVLTSVDLRYIRDKDRFQRKYYGVKISNKIIELFGDSATFDFASMTAKSGPIEFAFIDGSHSYEYVRNDTEQVLKILAPRGVVLWHDYDCSWEGVWSYLNELSRRLPLLHIEGTTLVYYAHDG